MMKKIILLLLMIIPINLYAASIDCDETNLKFGDYFECKLTDINTTLEYDSISGSLKTDDYISCVITNINGEIKNDETKLSFEITNEISSKDLITFKCQVVGKPSSNTNSQLIIENLKIKEKGKDETTEIVRSEYLKLEKYSNTTTTKVDTKPRDTSSPSSLLKGLTADEVKIPFSQYVLTPPTIQVEYEVEKITFHPVVEEGATYKIEGDTSLKVGTNVIDIYINSPDNSSTTCYTYTFERLARGEKVYKEESDSSLSELGVTNTNTKLGFDKNQLEYTIVIGADVSRVDVTAIPTYKKAEVSIRGVDNLKNGSVIEIEVTSKDGTSTTTYKIHVRKERKKINILPYLGIIGFGAVIIFLIILIMKTNNKKKDDPILKLKHDKRKINKGDKLDQSNIPVANAQNMQDINQQVVNNVVPGTMINPVPVPNQVVTPVTPVEQVPVQPPAVESPQVVETPVATPQPIPTPVVDPTVEQPVAMPTPVDQVQTPVEMPQVVEQQPVVEPVVQATEVKETNIFDNPNQ